MVLGMDLPAYRRYCDHSRKFSNPSTKCFVSSLSFYLTRFSRKKNSVIYCSCNLARSKRISSGEKANMLGSIDRSNLAWSSRWSHTLREESRRRGGCCLNQINITNTIAEANVTAMPPIQAYCVTSWCFLEYAKTAKDSFALRVSHIPLLQTQRLKVLEKCSMQEHTIQKAFKTQSVLPNRLSERASSCK